jgi:hypothetical protein
VVGRGLGPTTVVGSISASNPTNCRMVVLDQLMISWSNMVWLTWANDPFIRLTVAKHYKLLAAADDRGVTQDRVVGLGTKVYDFQ